jgi:hypothetical protein
MQKEIHGVGHPNTQEVTERGSRLSWAIQQDSVSKKKKEIHGIWMHPRVGTLTIIYPSGIAFFFF